MKAFKVDFDGLMFKAARASTEEAFNETLAQMNAINPAAGKYVEDIDKAKWARAFFPVRRLGHVTSNISESSNRWLEEARKQDPVGVFSKFILKLNRMFEKRRNRYARMPDDRLPEKVVEIINSSIDLGRKLHILEHTQTIFEVESVSKPGVLRTVDLEALSCTCEFYNEHGVPCHHMCAAMLTLNKNPNCLVVPERRVGELKKLYVGTVIPVDVSLLKDDGMKAPKVTKKKGRPKTKRIPSCTEKAPRTVSCKLCGSRGHNKRSCPQKK